MSNTNATGSADHQSIQQNAGVVAPGTPIISNSQAPPPVQHYQIQQPSIVQSNNQSIVHQQQQQYQYAQQNSGSSNTNSTSYTANSIPHQGIIMPPNVNNFATNQQSDNIPNLPPANIVPTTQQQNQPSLTQPPIIRPLLSLESDQEIGTNGGDGKNQPLIDDSNDVPTNNTNQEDQKSQQQSSPQKSVITRVRLSDELNIFDWFRTTDIINQIAERAKSSVDSVITALDPGMKEYLYSGGNVNIIVISECDSFVSPMRDVFQTVFGRATVAAQTKQTSSSTETTATSFPIKLANGFNEAIKVAQERIKQVRLDTSHVPQNQVMIVVQPTIVHIMDSDSEKLHGLKIDENIFTGSYLTYCLILEDPVLGITLSSYSQLVPLDGEVLSILDSSKLPDDSSYHNLGYTISIDDLMNLRLKIAPPIQEGLECQWTQNWAGLDMSQIIRDSSSTLAHMYRRKWTDCVR